MISEDLQGDWRIENSTDDQHPFRLVRMLDGEREDHGCYDTWEEAEQAACDFEAAGD